MMNFKAFFLYFQLSTLSVIISTAQPADSVKVLPIQTYLMLVNRAWYWNAAKDSVIQSQDLHIQALQMVLDSTRYNHRQEVKALRGALNSSEQVTAGQVKLIEYWRKEATKGKGWKILGRWGPPVAFGLGVWAGSR